MDIAVLGLGYVGTVTAACLAAQGHHVIGVDVDADKVSMVNAGRSPVVEPGLPELLARAVALGRLRATTDIADGLRYAEVSIVCVGTPSALNGATDLTHVQRVVADIGRALVGGSGAHTVMVRSTVPPGTVEGVLGPILNEATGGELGLSVHLAMCPEFLREGSSVEDFLAPPFVVLGGTPLAVAPLRDMFAFLDAPVHEVPIPVAEGLKYACNAFHATKVAFANEIAQLYRHLGVDARTVMEVFVEDTILNVSPAYLRPGFAFGGSCLPKDVRSLMYLSRAHDIDSPLLHGVMASNDALVRNLADRVLRKVEEVGHGDRRVTMLGLAFKSQTDDLRESPSVDLAEYLIGKGLELNIHDPVVNPALLTGTNLRQVTERLPHLHRALFDTAEEALADSSVVVISSGARELRKAVLAAAPAAVFDLHGRLGADIEALPGYEGVGW